ncbi:hypothetical protein EV181_002132, partial [Coemansia sp. RSA 532]
SPRDDVRLHMLVNRTDSALIALLNGLVAILSKSSNDNARALKLAQRIRDACLAGQGGDPVYREHGPTTRPVTQIGTAGKIDYAELEREASFAAYVDNMMPMRIMDPAFRKRQIDRAFRDADRWSRDELEALDADAELISDPEEREQFVHVHRDMVTNKLQDTKAAALDTRC